MTFLKEETSKKYAILGSHRPLKRLGREAPHSELTPAGRLWFGSAFAPSARTHWRELPAQGSAHSASADSGAGSGSASVFALILLYCGSDALKGEGTPLF